LANALFRRFVTGHARSRGKRSAAYIGGLSPRQPNGP
jgi:hypothetical protein